MTILLQSDLKLNNEQFKEKNQEVMNMLHYQI